jgi:hypothetical protein
VTTDPGHKQRLGLVLLSIKEGLKKVVRDFDTRRFHSCAKYELT